jgi:hypothetical protein
VGEWVHIAITWDGSPDEVKFYINGVLDETVTSASTQPNTAGAADWHVYGYSSFTSNYQTGGLVDEIAIWHNTVITDFSEGGASGRKDNGILRGVGRGILTK